MVIVASFLASVFLKYLDLKDSVLAAYVTLSLASLCNWLVLKKPVTDVTIGLRWSVLLVIVAEIIFIVSFIQGAVASRMFEPVFNWFSATLLSSGSIKSVLNIYDLGGVAGLPQNHIFVCSFKFFRDSYFILGQLRNTRRNKNGLHNWIRVDCYSFSNWKVGWV